jgi:hypothetical protein
VTIACEFDSASTKARSSCDDVHAGRSVQAANFKKIDACFANIAPDAPQSA